ncbi:MAG: cation:proton antiporter [Euryarchaeota archaeon]|nr:cation:proton antiporter [Euryarchaeota archaeon]
MRKAIAIIISVAVFVILAYFFVTSSAPINYTTGGDYVNPINDHQANQSVPQQYLNDSRKDTGSQNVVTAIVVEYRGFDTLGEVTVLFTAATGLAILLGEYKRRIEKAVEPNFVTQVATVIILPFIVIVGAYIFIHGHLTPGGGFPGGAIIASGFLLLLLVETNRGLPEKKLSITESLAGMSYALIGLLGLVLANEFLENYLPTGIFGTVFSAGIIPLIYIAIGFKVGSELGGILHNIKGVHEE